MNISKTFLEQLPIKEPTDSVHKKIVGRVNAILALTSDSRYMKDADAQANVRDYEDEIDRLIYDLYSLNQGEIVIVEHGR